MSLVTGDIRHNYEDRVEKLRRKMAEQWLDGLYLSAGPNMFYFRGYYPYYRRWL